MAGGTLGVTERAPLEDSEESEESIIGLFGEDEAAGERPTYSVAKVRNRNVKAVAALKELYQHSCQITGTDFLFKKRNGVNYTEVHHLVPLGKGGADDPQNMIVLSPQLHRMLHYADVGPIDLARSFREPDGTTSLTITINRKPYQIRWRREHAQLIRGFA